MSPFLFLLPIPSLVVHTSTLPVSLVCVWHEALTINELAVVDGHPTDTPNEPEVTEVVLVALTRVRVDLKNVVVTGGGRSKERWGGQVS